MPYRTAAEMGVIDEREIPQNLRQTVAMPYVMGSGTYWSHVMIVHPAGVH